MKTFVVVVLYCFGIANMLFSQSNIKSFNIKLKKDLIFIDSVCINNCISLDDFIFDTGSQLTVIDSTFVTEIKLNIRGDSLISKDIIGNRKPRPIIIIDSIRIGDYTCYNVKAYIANLKLLNTSLNGIIGANVLRNNIWEIDFPLNKVSRLKNDKEIQGYDYNLPLSIKSDLLYFNINIAKAKIKNILFDTGNSNRLSLLEKDTNKLKYSSIIDNYYRVSSVSMNGLKVKQLKIKESLFSNVKFGCSPSVSTYAIFYGVQRCLGTPFIKDSKITIDYVNSKLYFNEFKIKMNTNKIGCRFSLADSNSIIVSSIREDSPADRIGIQLGDKLVYFEGYSNFDDLKKAVENNTLYDISKSSTLIKMGGWIKERKLEIF